MTKFFSNFILIASALIMSASVALYLSHQTGQLDFSTPEPSPEMTRKIYEEEGEPKYSDGACTKDTDCAPAGCSSHYCSSDPDLITTCELRDDFPNKETMSCGCVEGRCVWYQQ